MVCTVPNRAACLGRGSISRSNESQLRLGDCIDIQYNLRRIDTDPAKKSRPAQGLSRVFAPMSLQRSSPFHYCTDLFHDRIE